MKKFLFAFATCILFTACNSGSSYPDQDTSAVETNRDSTKPVDTLYPKTDTSAINMEKKDSAGLP